MTVRRERLLRVTSTDEFKIIVELARLKDAGWLVDKELHETGGIWEVVLRLRGPWDTP